MSVDPTSDSADVDFDAAAAASALAISLTTLGYASFALLVPGPLDNIQPITGDPSDPQTAIAAAQAAEDAAAQPVDLHIEPDENETGHATTEPDDAAEGHGGADLSERYPVTSAQGTAVAQDVAAYDTVALPTDEEAAVPEPAATPAPAAPAPSQGMRRSTLSMLQELSFLDEE